MSKERLNTDLFRERLMALRRELASVEEISSQSAETVELDQTRMGRLSRMDAMQAQAISVAAKLRMQAQRRQIEAALQRIQDDEYGWCVECAQRIDTKRLEFDPTALLCITCAQKAEQ